MGIGLRPVVLMAFPHRSCTRLLPAGTLLVCRLGAPLQGCHRSLFRQGLRACAASGIADAPASGKEPPYADAGAKAVEPPSFKVSIDFKFIKDNLELVKENCTHRNSSADPDLVCSLYDDFVELKQRCDRLRAERNESSKLMKVGLKCPVDGRVLCQEMLACEIFSCWLWAGR